MTKPGDDVRVIGARIELQVGDEVVTLVYDDGAITSEI